MTRTKIRRGLPPSLVVKPEAGLVGQEILYWEDPKGLDYQNPASRIDPAHAFEMTNLVVELGQTFSRPGSKILGQQLTSLMSVVKFITLSGRSHLLAFTTTGVYIYRGFDAAFESDAYQGTAQSFQTLSGNLWALVPGTYTLSGSTSDRFCFTTYGNTLLFSNGRQGIFEYDPTIGTITLISGSFPCRFMTTFDGRVLATNVRDPNHNISRIRWSVKNNSHDWSGDGSGYDDLIDTPGGQIDEQMGVFPISETRALAVRKTSVWVITVTGYALAPFRFSRFYDKIGTSSPYAITPLPNGVLLLASDDAYTVNDQGITLFGSGIKTVGTSVIKRIRTASDDVTNINGTYDMKHRRVLISSIESGQCVMYCYSLISSTWSRRKYPFTINSAIYVLDAKQSVRVQDLRGSVKSQTGTVEDLGGDASDSAAVMFTDSSFVHQEDESLTTDETAIGVQTNGSLDISTGVVRAGEATDRTEVIEVLVEILASVSQTLTVKYSTDGGATWNAYGTITVSASATAIQLLRTIKRIIADKVQLQLSSATLGSLTLIRFIPIVVKGEKILPA